VQSAWVGVDLAADRVAWARLLRRAHEVALSGNGTPPVLREVIVRSWARCLQGGVDPDRPAPRVLDPGETAARLATHPLSAVVATVAAMLGPVSEDARHLAALSDADGLLLWEDGHASMLEAASAPRFLPGSLVSESVVGTNAVGTTLVLDHAVQVFSAEHFNRLLHGWSSSAAPIHDPATGGVLGAIGLSGSFRTAHPHTLSLVGAVARAAEAALAREQKACDAELTARYVERLSSAGRRPSALVTGDGRVVAASPRGWLGRRIDLPAGTSSTILGDGTRAVVEHVGDGAHIVWGVRPRERRPPRRALYVGVLGDGAPEVVLDGRRLSLSARHIELLVVLALAPGGLSAGELGRALYPSAVKAVTVRAEIARLRRTVGDLVLAQPYRLAAKVRGDFLEVERLLRRGVIADAAALYAGPLLPASDAPAIVAARARLEAALMAVRSAGRPAARRELQVNGAPHSGADADRARLATAGRHRRAARA
jgi:hypothetical protein